MDFRITFKMVKVSALVGHKAETLTIINKSYQLIKLQMCFYVFAVSCYPLSTLGLFCAIAHSQRRHLSITISTGNSNSCFSILESIAPYSLDSGEASRL
jgi:hypothetical protein